MGIAMQVTVSKIFALLIALGYAAFLMIETGGLTAVTARTCLALLFPLALIWFPEEIGNLTGYFASGYVNVETPAIMVSIMGWLFLVGLPVLIYFLSQH